MLHACNMYQYNFGLISLRHRFPVTNLNFIWTPDPMDGMCLGPMDGMCFLSVAGSFSCITSLMVWRTRNFLQAEYLAVMNICGAHQTLQSISFHSLGRLQNDQSHSNSGSIMCSKHDGYITSGSHVRVAIGLIGAVGRDEDKQDCT